ncbi:MAG: phosphoribosylglycinamide formyltransferase, partial [Halobacteria archaeon]|nr:phosphoribosylglycinamide formyltransferase [Halobacteria archaeon]
MTKARVVGLTSGEGDNLFNFLGREEDIGGELVGVVSDRNSAALERAEENGVESKHVPLDGDTKREQESRLASTVEQLNADLIAIDGYMPILSPDFVNEFENRIMNVHPSLLPSFRSTDPWGDALDAGVEITGCTVHFVTEEIGMGPIVTQEPVRVEPDDDRESLRKRVKQAEYRAYPRAVRLFAEDKIEVEEGKVVKESEEGLPSQWVESVEKSSDLRYGENPHQDAAFYRDTAFRGASVGNARKLGGKEMS